MDYYLLSLSLYILETNKKNIYIYIYMFIYLKHLQLVTAKK